MDRISTDVGTSDVTEYGARLRRRWWLVALGILFGLGASALYTAVQHKTYTSTTSVLVVATGASTSSLDNSRTASDVNLDTEAQLVKSAQVGNAARTLLGVQTPVTALLQQVTVTVPPNSSVLSIAFDAGTARAAQQGSHSFAQAYLTNRTDDAKATIAAQVTGLQAQLKTAQDQLAAASARSAALVDNSPEKVLADAQRSVVVNQVNDLTNRLAPLQSTQVGAGQIITDAPLPQQASSPIPALNLGAGLAAGLLLGLASAVIADRADHRLRQPGDVTRQVGLPVLADVSATGRGAGRLPGDEHSAAFDRLRNTLVGSEQTVRALQVADPGGRGASGLVALQLARSLVRTQRESLLVIAHPESVLPETLGCDVQPGLVELLRRECTFEQACLRVQGLPGVTVLPPGGSDGELEQALQSPELHTLLAGLRSEFPVVLETLGTGDSAAAQAVSGASDVVLLVAERGRADGREVRRAADGAHHMGPEVAGVVLVPALTRAPRQHQGEHRADLDPGAEPALELDGDRPRGGHEHDGGGAAAGSTRLPSPAVLAKSVPASQPRPR